MTQQTESQPKQRLIIPILIAWTSLNSEVGDNPNVYLSAGFI